MANITQALFITGAIILLFYVATLLLIFSDLWAGVRKARSLAQVMSHSLKSPASWSRQT